jgi:endonuclease/exonuclease/phosphatase family metal-dependent hydrolase
MWRMARRSAGWILKTAAVLCAVGVVCAYLARYVSPAGTWLFAFFGLIFPYLAFANLLFCLLWLCVKRKLLWLQLAVLVPSFFFAPAYGQWRKRNVDSLLAEAGDLKIMTYNVHSFNLLPNKKALADIAAFIKQESPAVVCLQEAGVSDTAAVKRALGDYPYVHFQPRKTAGYSLFSTATFSRYPIRGKGVIVFPHSNNVCLYTDIAIDGHTVRVYNNHLESTRLNLALSFARIKSDASRNREIKNVTVRLRDSFIKRARQVDTVAAHIAASPYPTLVCGDFNDMPMSYTYRKMKGALHDTFIDAGAGVPSSFRSHLPAFRIDYIFRDRFFATTRFDIYKVEYSDHYPVVAVVRVIE